MSAVVDHTVGEHYSGHNKVPTIQKFEEERAAQQQQDADAAEAHATNGDPPTSGKEAKDDMMKRATNQGPKPTDEIEKQRKKGPRTVKDPVTGQQVLIRDAEFKDYQGGKLDHLDPKDPTAGPATMPAALAAVAPSKTAPNPALPGNVLIHDFPAPVDVQLKPFVSRMERAMFVLIGGSMLLWSFTAFGHGFRHFAWVSTLIGGLCVAQTTLVSLAQRGVEKEVERVRADMARARGEAFAPPTPESVEWLNAFIKVLWGLVNPEMFVPIADTVEDVMQQSLPGFVDAVRITDIGQGTNPFRIISMRALPDQPGDNGYPHEEWVGLGGASEANNELAKTRDGKGPGVEQSGDYVNYEVAFSYQALPGQGDKLRAKNIHLMLEFFLGALDWFHIPVPIWVQVEGICGTVRLRLQFIPEFPYVRNLTFTLMGVPAVDVSVQPLTRAIPNLLDLPFISRFVKMAIAAGTAELVAPKSMTLNIQEIMSAAVVGDTQALGVFVITIHHAEGLQARDRNGKSDPYIVLAYAKFGKPLFSTRIILEDLNPVFEETAMLIVTHNEVKAEEDVSAMLWDSDRGSADDLLGRVQIPVKKLMEQPNKIFERTDALMGFEDANEMQGKIHWSIGYFEKCPLNKDLERPAELPKDPKDIPDRPPRSAPEMTMRPGDKAPNPAAKDLPPAPPDVRRTPPDPEWPSGVLSVIVHQINNLERQNLRGTSGKDREGQAGQDTDEPTEQSSNLPSAYCEIIVNDDLVYKTRVKQYSTMPFFEAGTELFVRDWRKAEVRIVVRDSRLRERDPILGIVNLPLAKVLAEGSEVTALYSIQEGIGFGRANISLLFKSVKLQLPAHELGWDTATVEVTNKPLHLEISPAYKDKIKWAQSGTNLRVSTTDSTEKLPKADAVVDEHGTVSWEFEQLRLPVYSRYASSIVFEFGTGGFLDRGPDALAVYWLREIADNEEKVIEIPVITGKDLKAMRQNVHTEFALKTHNYEVVGTLKVALKVDPGLDMDHATNAKSQTRRHAFEAYDHIEGEAEVAEQNAHFRDDGLLDKDEKKALKQAEARQLENRQRGKSGYKPYRTMKWMGRGIMDRIMPNKPAKREPNVETEA